MLTSLEASDNVLHVKRFVLNAFPPSDAGPECPPVACWWLPRAWHRSVQCDTSSLSNRLWKRRSYLAHTVHSCWSDIGSTNVGLQYHRKRGVGAER